MTFYFFKNKKALVAMRCIDGCLSLLIKQKATLRPPQKILLSNMAHLGDLIMATAVLPVLRRSFPKATIGIIVGSWNEEVVQHHPMIDAWYTFDHIKLNRRDKGFWKKLKAHFLTRRKALQRLRYDDYDVAIDLYYYFPNSSVLFWQANIPMRLGYSSGGLGALFTHAFAYEEKDQYLATYYIPFLETLGVAKEDLSLLHTTLPSAAAPQGEYVVIHMGTGDPQREWSDENWNQLIQLLDVQGVKLVFTGWGEKEKKRIQRLRNVAGIDLCNALNFSNLCSYIKGALLTISPDTSIFHIAAAYQVPSLVLFSKEVNPDQRLQNQALTIKMSLSDSADMVYKRAHECLNC